MSLHDFWINVRSAFRVPGPDAPEAPRLDAAAIEAALRKSSDWLAVDTIDGFDEADFSFLPDADRKRLKDRVEAFRPLASTRKFRRPPTPKAVEEAVPILREIIQILEFDRYDSPEALRLGKRIERAVQNDAPPRSWSDSDSAKGWTIPARRACGSGSSCPTRSPTATIASWRRRGRYGPGSIGSQGARRRTIGLTSPSVPPPRRPRWWKCHEGESRLRGVGSRPGRRRGPRLPRLVPPLGGLEQAAAMSL